MVLYTQGTMFTKITSIVFPSSLIAGSMLGVVVTHTNNTPVAQANEASAERFAQAAGAPTCTLPYEGGLSAHMSSEYSGDIFTVGCGGVF